MLYHVCANYDQHTLQREAKKHEIVAVEHDDAAMGNLDSMRALDNRSRT